MIFPVHPIRIHIVPKVLIVDDSRSARYFLKSCIPKEGFEILEASNGEEGIKRFQDEGPDVVFMDLTMPVMDGFAAIPRVFEIDPKAKIIVLTADVQKQTVSRITSLGVELFLKKPPRKEKVLEALGTVFPDLIPASGDP